MIRFAVGDRVHVARIGTGVVREVRNGGRYLGASPSKKSVTRIKARISTILDRRTTARWVDICKGLNRVLRGWARYFDYGSCTPAYRAIDQHVASRARHLPGVVAAEGQDGLLPAPERQ